MRLLICSDTGDFSLTKDLVDDEIPPYAILSHTWLADTEELTFEDVTNGEGKEKLGYEKIWFCGEQARRDGLKHFWVDTCCINKANYNELSRSINSMFRWYRNAAQCYVYLSDVWTTTQKSSDGLAEFTWESAFRASRWFSRGWTLQELLAPAEVKFFSKEGKPLGCKKSLERQIHEITGIPKTALQGAHLSQFRVNERFLWMQRRETKLAEDKVYALLGIFDVEIPLIYGEGTASAFRRLWEEIEKLEKCIQDLRLTDPRDDKKRIEDTKGGLLEDSYRWILENTDFQQWRNDPQSRLLWIKGDPGKGKTMLLCGVINELGKSIPKTGLLSYFFCQATDSRINNATAVLRGLMYMLVHQQLSLISHILNKYDHAGKGLFGDANTWVALVEIFTNMLQDPNLNRTYLIIDALDECVTDLPKLLNFIVQSSTSSRIKWIVSSRNWPDIEERLERAGHRVRLCLELNAESVSTAVSKYVQHKVIDLAKRKKYNDKTREAILHYLSSNANDTFLWVALVCQNLENSPRWNTLPELNTFPPGLDSLYQRMMEQICDSDNDDLCKRILASIAIVYRPLTLKELTSLVEMLEDMSNDLESVGEIVSLCGSFLAIRERTVYFIHQSAKEYLLTQAFDKIFPSGRKEAHYIIFSRSLQVMSRTLRRDIYSLCAPGYPIEQVKQPHTDPLAASRYSCIYWVDHLCNSDPVSSASHVEDLQDGGVVDTFLKEKYLYWLEALSLCKSMPKGVVSMANLHSLVQGREEKTSFTKLVYDAYRFVMYHRGAIECSPLQAYASALLFSPTRSSVRRLFQHEELEWITTKPAVEDNWNACLQTLEGHGGSVRSVAFSHDSTRLASASEDQTIKIWDASSGECLQTLKGHDSSVWSVAFSHDSTRLASGSGDNTVKIWDASSGKCLQTLEGHCNWVNLVTFSHNSTRLASASEDRTVKIWDASSGECLQTLEGHVESVYSVAFSHDSTRLASASDDQTVKIWDATSGKCLQTLEGHVDWVRSVAFSHDSTRLASASDDQTVKIWDATSGKCLQTLEGHVGWVNSVAFSHDSTRLVSGSADQTVKIWDATSGKCLQTLEGHVGWVRSVAFSHDSTRLASGSVNQMVKIWDASSGECLQMLESHCSLVNLVVFSHDSTQLASASNDQTVKIWDAGSGECLQTFEGHVDWIHSVAFSHDSTRLSSASADETVKIWNASSGECLQTLEGHVDWVYSVAFSHDSTRLVSGSADQTVKIWDASSGECLQTLGGHCNDVSSVTFSHNSTWVASVSDDKTVKIWDANSGECLQTLEGHCNDVSSVTFSHNSTWLALVSDNKMVTIWDTNSGECLQMFKAGKKYSNILFDSTSLYLDTEIGIVHISASTWLSLFPTISELQFQGLGLSLDEAWITYNSENLVWLPSEYRPSYSAISEKIIGIGVRSGKVWICKV